MQMDADYFGSDIANKELGTWEDCCQWCQSTVGCQAWTFPPYKKCFLKSQAGALRAGKKDYITGKVTRSLEMTTSVPGNGNCPHITVSLSSVMRASSSIFRVPNADGC